MTYKLLVRFKGLWQQVGFSHLTREEAHNEAKTMWGGYAFIVVPE